MSAAQLFLSRSRRDVGVFFDSRQTAEPGFRDALIRTQSSQAKDGQRGEKNCEYSMQSMCCVAKHLRPSLNRHHPMWPMFGNLQTYQTRRGSGPHADDALCFPSHLGLSIRQLPSLITSRLTPPQSDRTETNLKIIRFLASVTCSDLEITALRLTSCIISRLVCVYVRRVRLTDQI